MGRYWRLYLNGSDELMVMNDKINTVNFPPAPVKAGIRQSYQLTHTGHKTRVFCGFKHFINV